MTITDVSHETTTLTTFLTPTKPVVELPRGNGRSLRVVAHGVEVRQVHGHAQPQVFVSGPFLRADNTLGAWHQHRVHDVPADLQQLVDEATAGVAL